MKEDINHISLEGKKILIDGLELRKVKSININRDWSNGSRTEVTLKIDAQVKGLDGTKNITNPYQKAMTRDEYEKLVGEK